MKSVRPHLLVTLLATAAAAGAFAARGLPPTSGFFEAVRRGDRIQVRRNLNWGADVNARERPARAGMGFAHGGMVHGRWFSFGMSTTSGWTALQWAAERGYADVAKLLLARGAAVEVADDRGFRPLHCAAFGGSEEVGALLIDRGADVKSETNSGMTALHWAAVRGNTAMAALLIARGADVHARNEDGLTPMDAGMVMSHEETVQLLRQHGATE